MYHRPTQPHMEQNDTKSVARSCCGVELASQERKKKKKKKMEKTSYLVPLGSVFRWPFRWLSKTVLDVESLVEHDGEGLKS